MIGISIRPRRQRLAHTFDAYLQSQVVARLPGVTCGLGMNLKGCGRGTSVSPMSDIPSFVTRGMRGFWPKHLIPVASDLLCGLTQGLLPPLAWGYAFRRILLLHTTYLPLREEGLTCLAISLAANPRRHIILSTSLSSHCALDVLF